MLVFFGRVTNALPSRKLIFYISIITSMLAMSEMTAIYKSLSDESKVMKLCHGLNQYIIFVPSCGALGEKAVGGRHFLSL